MIRRFLAAIPSLALLCCLAPTAPVEAASKVAIAALGDAAPGGGVFAGPSFVGEPSAAGSGWLAFRAQVTAGNTTEQIVVANVLTNAREAVASVGQTVSAEIGRFKQFLGRPTVNARGDVAFAAEITPPDDAPSDPFAPIPGGVFLWSQGEISVIVAPGYDSGFGILDLTTPINLLTAVSGVDVAERTPALNDNGDVAFVAATFSPGSFGGAIFLRRAGQDLTPVLKLGDPYESGSFQILGPPALNNGGTIAFHGFVDGPVPLDGVFKLEGGTLSLLIRDGETPATLDAPFTIDPLFEFGDVVALNDAGDVACTGGPVFDNSDDASLSDLEGSPGVILIQNGLSLLVGFPGQEGALFDGQITDLVLGPEQGSRVAAPGLTPDGQVFFFAQLNNGSSQAVMRVDPATRVVRPLVRLGGGSPDASPAGGTFLSASSAPAVDAVGNFAFNARIENSTTSEALVWIPPAGPEAGEAVSIGDAVPEPGSGFFGGPAFFPPVLNDAGQVVFRSYVARGPALGIFRYRQGELDAVVRVRDVAPVSDGARFSNLVGEPSLNANGDVAFAATLAGRAGRGIFVASAGTLRAVALPFEDLVPADSNRPGAFLRTIAANPSISDSGAVVFRGVIQFESRFGFLFPDERENCVFLADDTGVRVLAAQGQDSGAGRPFLNFRDPTIGGGSVLFRAPLGEIIEEQVGLFLMGPAGLQRVAVEGDDLGGMTLETLQGKGLFDAAGDVFFSAKVRFAGGSDGAIVRSGAAGFEAVVQTGTTGPEGGLIRSLGRPSVSSNGRVALRLGFEPFTGGVPGLFLSRNDVLRSYLRIGEGGAAGINGRITSLNQNISLNASDQVAVLASVGGGRSRSAIFLASPAALRVPQLLFKRAPTTLSDTAAPKPRDRVKLSMVLEPGLLPPPTSTGDENDTRHVRRKAVTVTVSDTLSTLWTGTLPSVDTRLRGRTLGKLGNASGSRIGNLRVQFARDGALRIRVRSRPFDLSFSARGSHHFDETGAVILEPPFSVRVDVGEDGASVVIPCGAKGRRFTCRG